jgi:ABC-type antimicrobial peptide transport system permease subunit
VGVAVLAGLPVSYWLLGQWLERFEFRIELSWYYFVGAGALALTIAWLTVASQAWKAARLNPVRSLRSE